MMLDPLGPPGGEVALPPGTTFKHVMPFVIGGITHAEMHNIRHWAATCKPPRAVTLGGTDITTGASLLDELAGLSGK